MLPSIRHRKALYRASHRGTRELDFILGRFAETAVPGYGDDDCTTFERLLEQPDPALMDWVVNGGSSGDSAIDRLIATIRSFHGMIPE